MNWIFELINITVPTSKENLNATQIKFVFIDTHFA